jgi:hypothetical protein
LELLFSSKVCRRRFSRARRQINKRLD